MQAFAVPGGVSAMAWKAAAPAGTSALVTASSTNGALTVWERQQEAYFPTASFSAVGDIAGAAFPGVNALAFTPDARHLATAHMDHSVRIWDTASWREACPPLHGHNLVRLRN